MEYDLGHRKTTVPNCRLHLPVREILLNACVFPAFSWQDPRTLVLLSATVKSPRKSIQGALTLSDPARAQWLWFWPQGPVWPPCCSLLRVLQETPSVVQPGGSRSFW